MFIGGKNAKLSLNVSLHSHTINFEIVRLAEYICQPF